MKRPTLALWAARTRTAQRLADGASIVYRTHTEALAAWVRAGRREDLTGWRGALGPLLRLACLALVGYVLYSIIRALPSLMWLLAALFLRAAWRSTRTPDEEPEEASDEEEAAPGAEAVRALLLECLGNSPAVHLSTVLAHLQQRGLGEGWTVSDLRARLEALGIPVRPKVKVNGSPTRGVHRDDLQAPSPVTDQEASPAPSTAA